MKSKRTSNIIPLFLALLSLGIGAVTPARAEGIGETSNISPHIISTTVVPRNHRATFAAYKIRLHILGYPISHLKISHSRLLKIKDVISVTNQQDQPIETRTIFEPRAIRIAFDQPVEPNQILNIQLRNVQHGTLLHRIWQLPLSVQSIEQRTEIPIGIARIHTY